ncbi:hypothetical protein RA307_23135 [Xanthobacteraceae bacterium Astr-EGSB]|uniref:hypothetical protein n=1 Tax=Astrobacterium formosum TaxID=3069710 RepID=UPI0027B24EAE|nr:hypothetical protein [Xanthobacteraceae bacterium Astr-EGSB]
MIDGLAIAGGATQAGIYARFASFLQQNMGLVGNSADTIDFALVPNNSLFIDDVTRVIYQWRDGVLEAAHVIGLLFTPKGAYAGGTPYAKNDLVTNAAGTGAFISNHDTNTGNAPPSVGSSNTHWTYLPLPAGPAGADGEDGQNGAPGAAVVTGASASSLAIGAGPKAFTIADATARGWGLGTRLRSTSTASPTHWMEGVVASYAHPNLSLTIDKINSSGTHADWVLTLVGQPGADGAAGVSGTSGLTRVRVVATGNVAIATGLESGDTIDGVTLATGDLVLLTAQSTMAQNGVYVVAASGVASRHADFNTYDALAGSYFSVMEGAANPDTLWRCTSNRGGTIDVTAVAVSKFSAGRELLTADRNYYVNSGTGNDSSDGRTTGAPFATIQKAIDTAATLDLSIYNVTIQLAAGTYSTPTGNVLKSAVGAGKIIIVGDETTPSNVVVTTSGAMVSTNHANFFARGVRTTYSIRGVRLKSTASGSTVGLGVQGGSQVEYQNVDFNTGFAQQVRTVDPGSVAYGTGAGYTISGPAGIHMNGSNLSSIQANSESNGSYTVTLIGTPAFTTFANASNLGYVSAIGVTYSGSATGSRYSAANNSVINTGGGGENYFPGNTAGTKSSGGIYN